MNIVSLSLSNTMFESSKNHPPEADEFEKVTLTPAPCEVVGAPRVEEAGVNMECLLDRVLPLGTDHLIIGCMARFHVRDELYGENSPPPSPASSLRLSALSANFSAFSSDLSARFSVRDCCPLAPSVQAKVEAKKTAIRSVKTVFVFPVAPSRCT